MKKLFENFRGDFFGGLTAGIVALPLALAFGVSSGLGPSAGLYGAIFICFFAALFGGTATQISGPTAPMTAVSMVIITGIIATSDGELEKALPIILSVFLLAGVMQIALGGLGIGKYIRYIPYPVVSGFMTAIGLIIVITQILPVVGYYPKEDQVYVEQFKPQAEELILENILKEEAGEGIMVLDDFSETVRRAELITEADILNEAKTLAGKESSGVIGAIKVLPKALSNIVWLELILALMTIIIIYGFKRITSTIPSTLVALILVSGVAVVFGLDYFPIERIPDGFPTFQMGIITEFNLNAITPFIFTAFTLAMLGSIDSLLTSVVADNMTKTKHNPNKELIGQGIGNSIAAFFGGLPGAGATIRTVINIKSGGKTKLSGMLAGLILLVILLGLGPIASKIPAAVLAGILITVGIGVMDYKGLRAIPSLPKDIKLGKLKFSSEVVIMVVVLILSTFWNLVYAVGIGLVIASLMFMKKIGDLTALRSDVKPLRDEVWKDQINIPMHLKEEVFIKHIKGPIFFGSTSDFMALADQVPKTAKAVVIRMGRVAYIDQSGLYAMEDVLVDLRKNGIRVIFVSLLPQPRYMLERVDMIPDLISEEYIFDNFDEAMVWVKNNVEDTSTALSINENGVVLNPAE